MKIPSNSKIIVGVGSALIDILAREEENFLAKTGAAKGGMLLVDRAFIEDALTRLTGKPAITPGGSACNTVVGISRLGGRARYVGKCGRDAMGRFFKESLIRDNVEPTLFTSSSPTGRVLSIITADAQRSMFTYLGASSETHPAEISEKCFRNAAIVHIEGYLLFKTDLILTILKTASKTGARISLDLASFTVVQEYRELLENIIAEYVDILLANEDEALALTGYKDDMKAIEALGTKAEISVLKVGKRGSMIASGGRVIKIDPLGDGTALDTTGAGDLWAAGFLYGLVNGFDLERCGRLASACGYEVCRVMGARVPQDGWRRIIRFLE